MSKSLSSSKICLKGSNGGTPTQRNKACFQATSLEATKGSTAKSGERIGRLGGEDYSSVDN